jgi:hypothetical protein
VAFGGCSLSYYMATFINALLMPTFKLYNFKAPIELQRALDRVVYEDGWDSASQFMREKITNDVRIQEALKAIENEKVRNSQSPETAY